MNAARLRELTDLLVRVEDDLKIEAMIQGLVSDLNQMTNDPAQPTYQTKFAEDLGTFRTAWRKMTESFSPAQVKLLAEIGAAPHFIDDVPLQIDEAMRANNVTPAVIRDTVEAIRASREQYIAIIRDLRSRLIAVGVQPYQLEPDSAEIGLLLPREMFGNELAGLISELRVLNRVIRAFSEIAVGQAEPVEIHQISTSDPIFFFGIAPATVALLAAAVRWAIGTWKEVEEIRKIRADTLKIKSFTPEEVDKIFSKKIEDQIAIAVNEKVEELVKISEGAGRHHEQRNDLSWALNSILARVERGMTVEVRFLPPPQPKEGEVPSENAAAFETLREVAPQLRFPASDPNPVLSLPPATPPGEPAGAK